MILLCRIDEIHQQLEEQLSVLSHFIDGVANLRPKGMPLSLVLLVTFSTSSTNYDLLYSCHVPKVTRASRRNDMWISGLKWSSLEFFAPGVIINN